jgi:hypothetical protein
MAKQGKVLPARRAPEREPSVLLRSAESLGRVIGLLQRQLDGASKRDVDVIDELAPPHRSRNGDARPSLRASRTDTQSKPKRKASAAKSLATGKAGAVSKARSTKKAAPGSTARPRAKNRAGRK